MKTLGIAACAAFTLMTATSAMAGGYWQNGVYYSYPSTQTTTTYTAPSSTIVGSVGPIQTAPITAYPPVTTIAPAATTTYAAPVTTYLPPASTVYAPAPTYYAPPVYDGRDRVRNRIRNQRNRIERALNRGDLRRGEERRLREGLREIRRTFRAYRDNDGYIGRFEEAQLMDMLNRNSKRIRRLANNDRVAGGYRTGPYAY